MKFYKRKDILEKMESVVAFKTPFSLIRFGDGGLKFLHAIFNQEERQLQIINRKEGLPQNMSVEVLEMWGYYARRADIIDTPEVYYDGSFWPRIKNPGKSITKKTDKKMRDWRELYCNAEFDNENYCNPEINCLLALDIPTQRNIFNFMNGKKICIITAKPEIKHVLYNYNIDIVEIVSQYENHYYKSFKKVTRIIKHTATKYDFWFVAAGELGRLYSGMIKENGGRSLDVGFLIDYWTDEYLHPRFYKFIRQSLTNKLEFRLTEEGKKYIDGI